MFKRCCLPLLLAALFLAACGESPTELPLEATKPPIVTEAPVNEQSISLTDGLARVVVLPTPAERIVSLTPAGTEALFAVGAWEQVVGRDLFSDFPPEAAAVQDIGGSWGEYNLEAIVSLEPDLVLAGGINPPELVAALEDLGLTTFFLPNPKTLEEMYANLATLGTLTGHRAEAVALTTSLAARVTAVDAALAGIAEKPTVYYELDATNPSAPYTAGAGTFVDQLITRAGGTNIGSTLAGEWVTISMEQLLLADPDIILLGDALYGETPDKVAARPGWEALTAVHNASIFPFDDNLASRPGPRLVDGLEALAALLHPEVQK